MSRSVSAAALTAAVEQNALAQRLLTIATGADARRSSRVAALKDRRAF